MKYSAILIFTRTNKPSTSSGIINVDADGCNGSIDGIDIKVENKQVTITNTSYIARFCIGIVG
ncbi:hypothetical protein DXB97_04190 [Firmicutes bacterium OM07-11]|nr:hypothetical protein DXB97_04190 [Firmicutes bacterium OM07-11]